MSNFMKRNTIGKFNDLSESLDQEIGNSFSTINYIAESTKKRLDRSLQSRFGDKSIKQLGAEINPEHKYRIYTNSMNPSVQVRKGRINIAPKVLEYEINRWQTDSNEKIGIVLGDDGLVRYRIQTIGEKWKTVERLVTLKQMNTDTREWVGKKVSDAIDNSAIKYAWQAKLASLMWKNHLSFEYKTASGLKSSRNFSVSFLYDFITGAYREAQHPYYKKRAVIDAIASHMQQGILGSLKKQKSISEDMSREGLRSLVTGADITNLKREDINAYDGVFKREYGVQRQQTSLEWNGTFEDIARAAGFDPDALMREQETPEEQSKEEENTTAENQESSTESWEQTSDIVAQITDFIQSPAKYSYDEIAAQLAVWSLSGNIDETKITRAEKAIEAINKAGKFAAASQGNLSQKQTNAISLQWYEQMEDYLENASQYTRDEVEWYLADWWEQWQITEKLYDRFLKRMEKVSFKDENIQAQAVA